MIRGFGSEMLSAYSQTLNVHEAEATQFEPPHKITVLSGPFLVSRTGDAG